MIFLKTEDEIELLRQSNLLVGKTLAEVAKLVKPGVTTRELDKVAEEFIRDHGATPTFKGFPNHHRNHSCKFRNPLIRYRHLSVRYPQGFHVLPVR